MSIVDTIKPFVDAGFAIHWLKPQSKAPAGGRSWQDAPVASLDDLRRTHIDGNNVGTRLGEPSRTAWGYLYVIDADIRIAEMADEAWSRLEELLPGTRASLPCVASGSGGESRHLYFVSDKVFRSKKLATSAGKHRGTDGKWHYDWELELFGTGKQVAMPPSIHPSGKPYVWEREFDFDGLDGFPSIPASVLEALAVAEDQTFGFETRDPLEFKPGQLEADLDLIPISDLDYDDWLRLGQALHHQFGGAQEGFDLWLQHTRRSAKFTGEAQVREMRRIKWRSFGRYRGQPVTMGTVRAWAQAARLDAIVGDLDDFDDLDEPAAASDDDASDFDDLIDAPTAVDDDDLDAVFSKGLDKPGDALPWKSLLAVNKDGEGLAANLHNLRLIVENDPRTAGVVAFNEFTQEVVQRGTPGIRPQRKNAAKPAVQLTGPSWLVRDPVNGDFWTEDKDNAIRAVIEAPNTQCGYGIKVPDRDLRAAVDIVGRKQAFHPVREYLSSLTWDGKPRAESLFVDYMGASDDAYHRHVARITLIAAVARVHEPGHKFDTAVILEGVQGKRKSTFISILAKQWFVELDCDVTDTQAVVELLQGAWIVELNELGGFTKADVRHVKAFISRRSDKVRLAYAKRAQEFRRQSILIGSTNDDVYLRDSTGGRRFLPVRCQIDGEINTERLASEIDQIWAEALVFYRDMRAAQPSGTLPLYLSDREARETAERLQESRQVESSEEAIAGRLEEWLSKPIVSGSIDDDLDANGKPLYRNETCLLELWCECLGREEAQYTGAWPAALGRAMRMVPGWRESARRPRFGKYGQQRAFEREGWVAQHLSPKG